MYEIAGLFLSERQRLFDKLSDRFEKAYNLNRQLVSFQANKEEPISRWFKYKEGFSSSIVKYFLTEYSNKPGRILDPFAGVGTTLFAGQALGWKAYGIELLPVGVFVMEAREALQKTDSEELKKNIEALWLELKKIKEPKTYFNHLSITRDAFPDETETALNKFLTYCDTLKNGKIQIILRFAAFSILEELSYTRKDGQYLRWDYRSKRDLNGKPFNKGKIVPFDQALKQKLSQIVSDMSPQNDSLFNFGENNNHTQKDIKLVKGTCLEKLPQMEEDFFDFIITSPPYCN